MSWFSKKLKKITKVADPIGAKLRKSTGGSYGDPMNWYQSKPKPVVPYQRPEKMGLQADPGTGGPTVNLGGGGNYTPNPFAGQMAQAGALRSPGSLGQSSMAQGIQPAAGGFRPGSGVFRDVASQYMAANPMDPNVGMAPEGQMQPQQMQNGMMRPGGRTPGMMF